MIDAESRSEVRSDLKDLKPTVLLVGAVLYAAALIVVFFLVMPSSSSPSHLCCGETVGDPSITVHEKEWSISAPKVWSMGYHEVNVVNVGKVPHELVMFKTDLTAVQLLSNPGTSIRASGPFAGMLNEDSPDLVSVLDSGNSIPPGTSRVVPSGPLTPGHYVLMCDLPGHYAKGMYEDITVAP